MSYINFFKCEILGCYFDLDKSTTVSKEIFSLSEEEYEVQEYVSIDEFHSFVDSLKQKICM